MRERLTAAFVVACLVVGVAVFSARAITLTSAFRHDAWQTLRDQARATAAGIDQRVQDRQQVDAAFLDHFTGHDIRIDYRAADLTHVVTSGPDYVGDQVKAGAPSTDGTHDLIATASTSGGGVVLLERDSSSTTSLVFADPTEIVVLFLLLVVVAGAVGFLISRILSEPFRQLAKAAGMLGRGRFELDLPHSRIPEAQSIAMALEVSAAQLRDRLAGGQALAEQASHTLRTPMTSLRLELEDLSLYGELPPDVQEAIDRCIGKIDSLDMVTDELVQLARSTARVEGAGISLRELATTSTQRWADELSHQHRALTAAVEGELDMTFTPGPVEHILELLLMHTMHRSRGAVRLVYAAGEDGHLQIRLTSAGRDSLRGRMANADSPYNRARAVVSALGGRTEGEDPSAGVVIWLPRH
jgi:methyl-accepting chemotaxis protein